MQPQIQYDSKGKPGQQPEQQVVGKTAKQKTVGQW
jgi:hypothetical protein